MYQDCTGNHAKLQEAYPPNLGIIRKSVPYMGMDSRLFLSENSVFGYVGHVCGVTVSYGNKSRTIRDRIM
jgi:hypothetical protein